VEGMKSIKFLEFTMIFLFVVHILMFLVNMFVFAFPYEYRFGVTILFAVFFIQYSIKVCILKKRKWKG
jgi:hypothetical protein